MEYTNQQWRDMTKMTAAQWRKAVLEDRPDVAINLLMLFDNVVSNWKDIRYYNLVYLDVLLKVLE
jgi:hypothetical protein